MIEPRTNRNFVGRVINPPPLPVSFTAASAISQGDSIEISQRADIDPKGIITTVFGEFQRKSLSPQAVQENGRIYFLDCLMQNPNFIAQLGKENLYFQLALFIGGTSITEPLPSGSQELS